MKAKPYSKGDLVVWATEKPKKEGNVFESEFEPFWGERHGTIGWHIALARADDSQRAAIFRLATAEEVQAEIDSLLSRASRLKERMPGKG